jgi:Ribbon-helix-helix protein, copG family
MSKQPYPLTLPDDLLDQVRRIAKETKLSMADVMRQAIRFGAPQVRKRLSVEEDMSEVAADTWDKLGPAPDIDYDKL